jgi:glycosyltransferase involved in cell wall biosynthesis
VRILLSSHGAGAYGAERMILALAQGLSSRGHQVVLELPHEGSSLEMAMELDGVEVRVSHRPRLPRNLPEGVRFFRGVPSSIWTIRELVREVRPDVTWVNSLFNPWALIGARAAGSPVVWHLHERNPGMPLGVLAPALMGSSRCRVAAISSFVAGSLTSFPWLEGKVMRLDNPLLQELDPVPNEPEGPFTVGYVGQMEPRKRAPDLARALLHLDGVRALFVGDGKARGAVEKVVQKHGLAGRAELLGFRENAPGEFHRFHCISIPSVREPFGLVALEAMASGIPVVAARSGALPEVLGGQPSFTTRKIQGILQDKSSVSGVPGSSEWISEPWDSNG